MPPKKNNVKMDLSSFLDNFGEAEDSWADEFDPSMLETNNSSVDVGVSIDIPNKEPEIPDAPPYTARISSLPDGVEEFEIKDFFAKGLKVSNIDSVLDDFYCPRDHDGNMKHFAFITFNSRELLVDALELNQKAIKNRPVTVGVAHPSKKERAPRGNRRYEDDNSLDWGAARGSATPREFNPSSFRTSGPPRERRREEPDFDWGAARGTATPKEFNPNSFRTSGPPRERKTQPADDFNWGAVRGTATPKEFNPNSFRSSGPPRERKTQPADEFNWGAARGTATPKEFNPNSFRSSGPPRERKTQPADEFNWGAVRGTATPKEFNPNSFRSSGPPKERKAQPADDFEWGARGSLLKQKTEEAQKKAAAKPKTNNNKSENVVTNGPQKSMFSVLQNEEEDDEEEVQEEQNKDVDEVTKSTAKLSVEGDEWTVV